MSLATAINLLTIVLCSAVLIQCVRMTRALNRFREADFPGTVAALEGATRHAEAVLASIKRVLAQEAEPKLAALSDARMAAEELGVMVGIANGTADRLLDASRTARKGTAKAPA